MTDLMYLSSTTSIYHLGETDVKTTAINMYFSHSFYIFDYNMVHQKNLCIVIILAIGAQLTDYTVRTDGRRLFEASHGALPLPCSDPTTHQKYPT